MVSVSCSLLVPEGLQPGLGACSLSPGLLPFISATHALCRWLQGLVPLR